MSITLRSHQDIANAFTKLGLKPETLESRKDFEKALDGVKKKDPALVAALGDIVLDGMKGKERERLQTFIGDSQKNGGNVPQAGVSVGTTVGGAGVMRFNLDAILDKKGRLSENTPEVAALLKQHNVDGPVDRPFERVLITAAKIDTILRGETDPEKLVDLVMAKDLRRQVFLLEGSSKMYSDIHGKPAERVYVSTKTLEDALGKVSMTKSNLAAAEKVKADPKVIALLTKDVAAARSELKGILVEDWMPDAKGRLPAMRDIVEDWGEAKWGSVEKDTEKVKDELSRRLEKLETTPYDMDQLETGVHELRRQLRWFPIYAESLNGLFQLDDTQNPIKAYEPLLKADIAASKYVQLPDSSREKDSIQIPKSVYCGLMQLTLDLGAAKDAGEPIHFIRDAYVRAGVSKDEGSAKATVDKLFGGPSAEADVLKNAHRLYDEMKKNGLVRALRHAVENG